MCNLFLSPVGERATQRWQGCGAVLKISSKDNKQITIILGYDLCRGLYLELAFINGLSYSGSKVRINKFIQLDFKHFKHTKNHYR